MKLSLKT